MAKTKPRKKYNPQQKYLRRTRHRAAQCIAYQWESEENEAGTTFNCGGPFPEEENVRLVQWAFNRTEFWVFSGIACFIDDQGEYYEELVTLRPEAPYNLQKDIGTLRDMKDTAIRAARNEGNPKHYVTSTFALSLQTSDLNRRMENDQWLKEQAGRRAEFVLKHPDALRALNGK